MSPPLVSILMVTYNSSAVLPACLDSLGSATAAAYEVIVVDNASSDDTVSLLRAMPEITLIENQQNSGYAAATNQAGRIAQGDYLLLLNPDTVLQPDSIDRLIAYLKDHPRVGIAAPFTLNAEGKIAVNSQEYHTPTSLICRAFFMGPFRNLAHRIFEQEVLKQDKDVYAVFGCALLIRADLFHKIGGLDERFFLFEEDIDLCYRVHSSGLGVVMVSGVIITHFGGQSSQSINDRGIQTDLFAFTCRLRSRSLYARKHFSRKAVFLLHICYSLVGIGGMLLGIFSRDHENRSRRNAVSRIYIQTGWEGLR